MYLYINRSKLLRILTWDPVLDTKLYTVEFNDQEDDDLSTTYSFYDDPFYFIEKMNETMLTLKTNLSRLYHIF